MTSLIGSVDMLLSSYIASNGIVVAAATLDAIQARFQTRLRLPTSAYTQMGMLAPKKRLKRVPTVCNILPSTIARQYSCIKMPL